MTVTHTLQLVEQAMCTLIMDLGTEYRQILNF
jgi:hypothetical protein